MAQPMDIDLTAQSHQAEYLEFLDDEKDQGVYYTSMKNMIKQKECRLVVNINDLRRKLPQRVKALMLNAIEEIVLFQRALKECIHHLDPNFGLEHPDIFIGFEGSFGKAHVTPRTLNTSQLGSIIAIEGIVTQCSLVQPKVVRSVHYCPATGKQIQRQYTDLTSFDAFPSSNIYPTKDEDGNPLETEYGLSEYKDNQMISIQEMPEKAPSGQMPRQVEVIVDNDLVDLCKPGDRVLVVGPYRCLPSKQGNFTSGSFRTIMLGTQISHVIKEESSQLLQSDIAKCKKFSKNKSAFDILARSLAPSIYGHEYVKKALLCMMLGGLEKTLPNGTRIRGDINILLIGDPSVAKSQLLRYVLNSAPRAVSTTGRGSSGVGLTAAVVTDSETGDRRLEAGAMVLADRGIVCIDEFDKMSDIDRTAIHEVMEQGRVTITKAGIQAKLNARCSVLAAANPIYGRYDQYRTPMENIGLQDSLLSRFDMIFILLDTPNEELDGNIADHVIRTHEYRAPNEADGAATPINSDADFLNTKKEDKPLVEEDESIWEKFDPKLHGPRRGVRGQASKIVSVSFMKKYLQIAKAIRPKMTKQASDIISEEYSKLRAHDEDHPDMARTQPVTARALETLIRLSTAHARARLSTTIDAIDAREAVGMVQFSHYQKVLEKPRKRNTHGDEESDQEEEDYDNMDVDGEETKPKKLRKKTKVESDDVYEVQSDPEVEEEFVSRDRVTNVAPDYPIVTVSDERLKHFQKFLFGIFRKEGRQSIETEKIFKAAEEAIGGAKFERAEVNSALKKMEDQNKVFVSGGLVILV